MASLFLFSRNRLPYFSNEANTPTVKIKFHFPCHIFSKLL